MLNELLCMEDYGDKKKFSIPKFLCRISYFSVGFGISVGTKAIMNRR